MPTYPLTFPSVGIVNSTFGLVRSTTSNRSPFSFRQQVYDFGGSMWRGDVEFKPMLNSDAASVKAFLADLQGQYGTFLYGDPDYLAVGARGSLGGTPLVNGAGQTGNTLAIDGASLSVTNWIRKGDYFQLGTGTSARLYMITEDANSNGSGEVTLTFQPALRSSPADNQAVTITGAKGLMRLASNTAEWSSNYRPIYGVRISYVEAINE